MFKDYINELIEKKFISLNVDKENKKSFSLTKRGNEFLEEYRIIERFVDNFGL